MLGAHLLVWVAGLLIIEFLPRGPASVIGGVKVCAREVLVSRTGL